MTDDGNSCGDRWRRIPKTDFSVHPGVFSDLEALVCELNDVALN